MSSKQTNKPPVVAILGPDGSGKSTVIDGIRVRLAARGLEMHTIHWRPDVINPRGGDGSPTPDPHAQAPRSYPESAVKLGMLFADWCLGYLGHSVARGARAHWYCATGTSTTCWSTRAATASKAHAGSPS